MKSDVFVSVVAPVINAEPFLEQYLREVSALLSARFKDYEIVLVDNRSSDGTVSLVERLQRDIQNVQLYCLARFIGLEGAFVVGIEHAIGDLVITMDPAFDPPERIPDLIELYGRGREIIYGLRQDRGGRLDQGGFYNMLARAFYALYRAITREDMPIELSSFRLLSRRVVNTFIQNQDRYNLFSVMPAFTGLHYATLTYERVNRKKGEHRTEYLDALGRAIKLLLLSSNRPLRMITFGSLVGATLSLCYAVYVVVVHLFKSDELASGWASMSLQISGLFLLHFIILAVMGEYLIQIFVHTQNRLPYLIVKESSSLVLSRKQELNVTLDTGGSPRTELPR